MVTLSGERVAVFRYEGKISALSSVCQHQNGPLGEGQIIDGCVTCIFSGSETQAVVSLVAEPLVVLKTVSP